MGWRKTLLKLGIPVLIAVGAASYWINKEHLKYQHSPQPKAESTLQTGDSLENIVQQITPTEISIPPISGKPPLTIEVKETKFLDITEELRNTIGLEGSVRKNVYHPYECIVKKHVHLEDIGPKAIYWKHGTSLRGESFSFGWSSRKWDKKNYPPEIGTLFYVSKNRRIISLNSSEFKQSNSAEVNYDATTTYKRYDFHESLDIVLFAGYDKGSFFVLADIPSSRKMIIRPSIDTGIRGCFIPGGHSVLFRTGKGSHRFHDFYWRDDVVFDWRDEKVIFYHPNHKILNATPDFKKLILYNTKNENHSLYDMETHKQIPFWGDKKHTSSEFFAEEIGDSGISPNGEFFAEDTEIWYKGSNKIVSFPYVKDSYIEIYNFKNRRTVKVERPKEKTWDEGRIGLLGIDNNGNLQTLIGQFRYDGIGYTFIPYPK